jgi:amino acid transporter
MTTTPEKSDYGLKTKVLSFPETLSQSVANISPTLTPVVIVPVVFATAGNGTWLAYLFATVSLMLVGMNINQFAKRSASPGSLYSFITRGLGLNAGFMAGWCLILAYIFTGMAVLAGSVNYGVILLGMMGVTTKSFLLPLALFGIGCLAAWFIAYKDIQLSTRLMLILEAVSMVVILILGVIIMTQKGVIIDTPQWQPSQMNFSGIKAGLVLAIFSYVGYESATTLGEEAKNPLKAIPRSVILSAVISGTFFMVTAYIAVLGFRGLKATLDQSTAPFNDLADAAGVHFFGVLISITAVISMFACTLASLNAGSRILFSMGRHGIFHSHMAKTHSSNSTPHMAATLAAIIIFVLPAIMLCTGFGILDVFNDLSTIATYGFLLVYAAVSVAAPVYLMHIGKVTLPAVAISVAAVFLMGFTIYSTVYPLPAAPMTYFPFYFLAYLVVGGVWYLFLRLKSPKVANEIKKDLEFVTNKFHPDLSVN